MPLAEHVDDGCQVLTSTALCGIITSCQTTQWERELFLPEISSVCVWVWVWVCVCVCGCGCACACGCVCVCVWCGCVCVCVTVCDCV